MINHTENKMYIKVNLRIFIFIIVFILTRQIEMYGLLMVFAFLHELGHLLVGIILGFKTEALSLNPLGLGIKFKINVKDYNKKIGKANKLAVKKTIIACAGPAVNFAIALFFKANNYNLCGIKNEFIIYSNVLIGIFNLIPIYPLDGGRILKNIIHIFKGLEASHTYINIISNLSIIILTMFASIGILYLKNIAILFILLYLWYLVIAQNRQYSQRTKIYDVLNDIEVYNNKNKILYTK